jgi:hypothetical protein
VSFPGLMDVPGSFYPVRLVLVTLDSLFDHDSRHFPEEPESPDQHVIG